MNKISLVAQREFLTRVRKKTFLLTTILLPLLIFGFYALLIYFMVDTQDNLNIAVADEANIFKGEIDSAYNNEDVKFTLLQHETKESLSGKIEQQQYDAYIFIPASFNVLAVDSLEIISGKTIGLTTKEK
ncbi:MAG TPA: ABC transporter permease [Chitinophagaceae bacterium]|nr:ABC transporter permease [Chitinophagaceae bacterium]